jgi:DNA end-binding protein Ku
MAGKTLWKGSIRFKDVSLPVKLHTAVHEQHVQFHLLHRRDHAKLHQRMICALEQTPVPPEEQVKGYELEERKYVLVDPAELEQAEPKGGRTIAVHEFVRTGQIDPVLFERAYYLEPDQSVQPYNALVAALKETGTAGICTWSVRRRSYFGALQANGKGLGLSTLRFADEMVPVKALDLQTSSLSEQELKVARSLIAQLSAHFQPEKFTNEHQQKLEDLVARKARGERIALRPPKRLRSTSPDRLLDALKASLKKVA